MMILDLNTQQKKAVTTLSQYTKVVAGAGSGKTRVLVARILFLIQQGLLPWRICSITFTNKAANEMKERLLTQSNGQSQGVTCSTIHSLCVRILREDIEVLKYPRNFTVLDASDQKTVLKEAYKELEIDVKEYPFSSMLGFISYAKTNHLSYETMVDQSYSKDNIKAEVYNYYQKRLERMFALDFDDLLLFTVRLFKESSHTLEKWQQKFDAVLVDEFQDIDQIQYTLIKQLVGKHNQLFVVGDPDQTIYTWRGADVNIIMDFQRHFKDCEIIVLDQNYRSTQTILTAANALIKYNRYREKKDLFTLNQENEKIKFLSFPSAQAQSDWIVGQIEQQYKQTKTYREIAILYRSNYLSRQLEKSLMIAQIPYHITGGLRFYDRAEIKDILSYLRLAYYQDDLSFLRIINVPRRGMGDKSIDKIRAWANQTSSTLYQALKEGDLLSGKVKKEMLAFITLIEQLKVDCLEMPIDKLIEKIFYESGLHQYYLSIHELDRIENVKELMNDAKTFMQTMPEATLDDYLASVALFGDKSERSMDLVSLMTVHSAKGLEFDTVFLCDFTEGIFPNERSLSESQLAIEEERRLAYVAITRAKKQLFISSAQGFSYVLNHYLTASRFIEEIGEENLEKITMNEYGVLIENNASPFVSYKTENQKEKQTNTYRIGDKITHTLFGDGVIVSLDKNIGKIAFQAPVGIKTLNLSHPAITKKEHKDA